MAAWAGRLQDRWRREGANIAVAGMRADSIAATQRRWQPSAAKHLGLVWDLADLAQIDGHVSKIESELGPVDILVNNTGGPPPTPASGQDPALWSKQFQSMVLSVIAITDRVLPNMRARHWGRIITSTSSGVVAPIPNLAISNALRLSLVGWSKTLAREVAKDGITANIVLPGRIATGRIKFLDEAKAKREGRSVEDVEAEKYGRHSRRPFGQAGRIRRRGSLSCQRTSRLYHRLRHPGGWRHDSEYLRLRHWSVNPPFTDLVP